MRIFKKLFSDKKKDVEDTPEETELENNEYIMCDHCKMQIHPEQRSKSYAGKKFHMKPCWFKIRKIAKACM